MKKINRKGFTLIELLAVIVIMAIIVVVTVPTIINTIADARVNSIWNLSVATANSYDTIAAQDMLASEKELDGIIIDEEWKCFIFVQNKYGKKLIDILGISRKDIREGGVSVRTDDLTQLKNHHCSSIRLKENGSVEILLVAEPGGKFAVSNKVVYALSSDDKGATNDA